MKFKFKNLVAIVLAVLICASVTISCPFALNSQNEAKDSTTSKSRFEMTIEELIEEVAPPKPVAGEPLVEILEPNGNFEDDKLGDVDGDGEISIMDATAIQMWLAQMDKIIKEDLADADGDGHISICDATVVQRYLVGLHSPNDAPLNSDEDVPTFEHTHLFNINANLDDLPCEDICKRVRKCACGAIQTITYPGHDYEVGKITPPTCEVEGTVYFKCKNCGYGFAERIAPLGHNFKEVITDPTCTKRGYVTLECQNDECEYSKITRYIDSTGHVSVHQDAKEATCTETGLTEGEYCSVCGEVLVEQKITPAKGHVEASPVEENKNHDGSYDEVVYCSVCNTELKRVHHAGSLHTHTPAEAVRENEVKATCTKPGSYDEVIYCKDCGEKISSTHNDTPINPDAHTPANSVKENEKAATCYATGSYDMVVYCSDCGKELSRTTETIQKLPHTPSEAVKENEVPATCIKTGSYDEVVYCSVCGEELSRKTITTPKTSHTKGNPVKENVKASTCKAKGSFDKVTYCSVCGIELSRSHMETPINTNAHTPSAAVRENERAATCSKIGSYDEVVYCKDCHKEISRTNKTIAKLDHTPSAAVRENEKAATCTNEGSYEEVVYCKNCHAEISRTTKTIDKSKHNFNYVEGKPATENEDGVKTHYECTVCNKVFDKDTKEEVSRESLTIPKLHDHTPASPVRENEKPATCTQEGSYDEVIYCSTCREELSRTHKIIDHLPHINEPPVKENEVKATCTKPGSYDEVIYCKNCHTEISRKTKTIAKLDHTPSAAVHENETAATCTKDGSYDEVVYCKNCHEEISRVTKKIAAAHTLTYEAEIPATTTKEGTKAHYKCSVCGKLFSYDNPKQEVTEDSLMIPKITQTDPSTCSHHWVRYVIPYNYADLYDNNRNAIPFTDDRTRNTLNQNNMRALYNQTGWAIYYCDKCHIADYDRFYTNQEFGRTQEEEEQLSLQYINDLRTSLGLEEVCLNSYTTAVAKERAKELVTDFSHDKARLGTSENIATCSGGAKRAFELWKASSGHYYNMTYDDDMYFGYAYAVVPPSENGNYHWRLVMIQVFKVIRW